MAINIEKVINWFDVRVGKLTYSMYGRRDGSDGTADCSGSISKALKDAGANIAYLYSTVTLPAALKQNGFDLISTSRYWKAQRGDIVLMTTASSMAGSAGAGGHVGIMKNATDFISVDYYTGGARGTAVSTHKWANYGTKNRYYEIYRYRGYKPGGATAATPTPTPSTPKPATTSTGSVINPLKTSGSTHVIYGTSLKRILEDGYFTLTTDVLNIRTLPSTKGNTPVGTYTKGTKVKFDSHVVNEGYQWISFWSKDGRRFLAVGNHNGKGITVPYGTFSK